MKTSLPSADGRVCSHCRSTELSVHQRYVTANNGFRYKYRCRRCRSFQSETKDSAMYRVRTPISFIATVLMMRERVSARLHELLRCVALPLLLGRRNSRP